MMNLLYTRPLFDLSYGPGNEARIVAHHKVMVIWTDVNHYSHRYTCNGTSHYLLEQHSNVLPRQQEKVTFVAA